MARTKEENFLIAVYRHLAQLEDPEVPFDPQMIGKSIGYSPKSSLSMAKMLHRTNFLSKSGEGFYTLSSHGEQLVRSLINE